MKILVDGLAGCTKMDGNDMFEALQSQDNVTIKLYNPVNVLKPWNGICRMHDKYLIVDNYGYMLGGRNTFNLFLGSYNSGYKNHDLEVFVWNKGNTKEGSIGQLKEYFNSVWELDYSEEFHVKPGFLDSVAGQEAVLNINSKNEVNDEKYKEYYLNEDSDENTSQAGKISLIANPIHRNIKEPRVWNTLKNLMLEAKERVYLHTPYIICNDTMYEELSQVANKNIETELVLNAPEIGANPFGCTY